MSTAPSPDLPAPTDPVRGRAARAIDFNRRYAWLTGLLLWAAGAAVLAIHSTGLALPDPGRFAMLDVWLIGLGCLGCPILPMRSLGRWLKPQTCILVAVFCFALALLLTALTLGGALHTNALDDTFRVILPLAGGIQAINAADAEVHAVRRAQDSYRQGRRDVVLAQVDQRYAALAGLSQLEAMGPAELEALIDTAHSVLETKLSDHPRRRLVSVPCADGSAARRATVRVVAARRAEGMRTDRA